MINKYNWHDHMTVKIEIPSNDIITGAIIWPCSKAFAEKNNGGVHMDVVVVFTQTKMIFQDQFENCWREFGSEVEAKIIPASEAGYHKDSPDTVWWDHRCPA